MADGKTHVFYHNRGWVVCLILGALLGAALFYNKLYSLGIYLTALVIFYGIGEVLISPDLDQLAVGSQDGRLLTIGKRGLEKLKRKNVILRIVGGTAFMLIGILGLLVAQWSQTYAWVMQFLGGHRNPFSHGVGVGTLIRQLFFDLPLAGALYVLALYGKAHWGWQDVAYELYFDLWLFPLFLGQLVAWEISDSIHILLDTEWAKGRLYTPEVE